jgi:hypothetical protein
MQLGSGAAKGKANTDAIADFARELEDEITTGVGGEGGGGGDNPWGNDDLMDVNADDDDWSASLLPIPSFPPDFSDMNNFRCIQNSTSTKQSKSNTLTIDPTTTNQTHNIPYNPQQRLTRRSQIFIIHTLPTYKITTKSEITNTFIKSSLDAY